MIKIGLFESLGIEDIPQLQSVADRKKREKELKLFLCKECLLNPINFRYVPETLIEGVNIAKIEKSERCWGCSKKIS